MFVLTPNSATAVLSSTKSPVSNQQYILITNNSGATSLIGHYQANTQNLVGSFQVAPNTMIVLLKSANDTINAVPSVAVTAVKVRM